MHFHRERRSGVLIGHDFNIGSGIRLLRGFQCLIRFPAGVTRLVTSDSRSFISTSE